MEKQIFYHDTDAGGVVYYATYLHYLEEARTEFLQSKGLSVKDCHDQGLLFAVRKCDIIYRKPARYGDVITCTAELKKTTAAQLIFEQKIFLKNTPQLIIEATLTLVCLSSDFKPTILPDSLREKLIK